MMLLPTLSRPIITVILALLAGPVLAQPLADPGDAPEGDPAAIPDAPGRPAEVEDPGFRAYVQLLAARARAEAACAAASARHAKARAKAG